MHFTVIGQTVSSNFESAQCMKPRSVTSIQMTATEQYFPVPVMFIMPYKVVLNFESVDEIL